MWAGEEQLSAELTSPKGQPTQPGSCHLGKERLPQDGAFSGSSSEGAAVSPLVRRSTLGL